MKIAFVLGTRPEIIKISSIIKKLKKNQYSFILTTQHYDYEMSQRFIEDLDMPTPDSIITLSKIQNSKFDRATQLGEIITNLSKILTKIKPDSVVVLGDTNTVLASALTSLKCQIPVSHIESGLRSNDWRMPEEHNRILVDHMSELLFAPTKFTQKNLLNENVHGKIHVTGNTSIDAIKENITKSEKLFSLNVDTDDFVLFTIHRGENVDNQKDLSSIISAVIESKVNIIFPIHPRTLKRLKQFQLFDKIKNSKNIHYLTPLGYFDLLYLMKKCNYIISDSGGIQEESTSPYIHKKVIVVRKTTDRPEAEELGFCKVVGTKKQTILQTIQSFEKNPFLKKISSPYGNGKASEKIIKILKKNFP